MSLPSEDQAAVSALVAQLARTLCDVEPYGSAWEFHPTGVDSETAYSDLVRQLNELPAWATEGLSLPTL